MLGWLAAGEYREVGVTGWENVVKRRRSDAHYRRQFAVDPVRKSPTFLGNVPTATTQFKFRSTNIEKDNINASSRAAHDDEPLPGRRSQN